MNGFKRSLFTLLVVSPLVVGLTVTPTTGCKGEAATGAELYVTACARCHGDGLKGGIATGAATSRDLTDPKWQGSVTDAELREIIQNGRGQMPAFGTVLSIDKIDKIVKFIRSKKE